MRIWSEVQAINIGNRFGYGQGDIWWITFPKGWWLKSMNCSCGMQTNFDIWEFRTLINLLEICDRRSHLWEDPWYHFLYTNSHETMSRAIDNFSFLACQSNHYEPVTKSILIFLYSTCENLDTSSHVDFWAVL
jgi:hypothetical protein